MRNIVSHKQNAIKYHNIIIINLLKVLNLKYSVTTLTNQKYINEEIKSRLSSRNAYYHLVQNLLSYSWLSKIIRIKIYRITILHVVLNGHVKLGLSHCEMNIG